MTMETIRISYYESILFSFNISLSTQILHIYTYQIFFPLTYTISTQIFFQTSWITLYNIKKL